MRYRHIRKQAEEMSKMTIMMMTTMMDMKRNRRQLMKVSTWFRDRRPCLSLRSLSLRKHKCWDAHIFLSCFHMQCLLKGQASMWRIWVSRFEVRPSCLFEGGVSLKEAGHRRQALRHTAHQTTSLLLVSCSSQM